MNRTGKDIIGIVIHCSAGYGDLASMRRFWRSLGWRSDGYNRLVDLSGSVIEVVPFNLPSNGVKGYNAKYIHICYTGGVEKTNVNKALDSRSPAQKAGILKAIDEALDWIKATGGDVSKITIKGHRDFSPDKNGDGVISAWERIKECPSFDAIPEYKDTVKNYLAKNYLAKNYQQTLPVISDVEYVVRSGDTLSKIARLNNTTVTELQRKNSISGGDLIRVGQRLKI